MSDKVHTVQMHLMNPGVTSANGDFAFEMQARSSEGRIVKFELQARDAEDLYAKLGEYLKNQAKK